MWFKRGYSEARFFFLPEKGDMKRKQVRSACSNCRLKHARCDNERPCGGCVKAGLAESCVDAPRKQRKHNEEHSASRGAYNYLTLFDVRDSTKPSEVRIAFG